MVFSVDRGTAETFVLALGQEQGISETCSQPSVPRHINIPTRYGTFPLVTSSFAQNYLSTAEYEYEFSATAGPAIELLAMATDNEEEAVIAPLMRDRRPSLDESQESDVTSSSVFIWALTFAAAISGLLFGYEYVSMSLST